MNELDAFGKLIAEDLRDSILNDFLDAESGWGASTRMKDLHRIVESFDDAQRRDIRSLITSIVDAGIHDFLVAIMERRHGVLVTVDGVNVAEASDGLNGEIFTENGWFERFSQHKERGIQQADSGGTPDGRP